MSTLLAIWILMPLVVPAVLLLFGALCGLVRVGGLWRDSFDPAQLSAPRVYQFIASLLAAAAMLSGLLRSHGTSFAPLPTWLLATSGVGNAAYLGAKFASARMVKIVGTHPQREK